MHIPVPNNKLVAVTLAGALLTAIVAGSLAIPGDGPAQAGKQADVSGAGSEASQQVAADSPTPNRKFTPAVQTQSSYEEEHEEEDQEHEEHEEEDQEHEEHEEEDQEHEEGE